MAPIADKDEQPAGGKLHCYAYLSWQDGALAEPTMQERTWFHKSSDLKKLQKQELDYVVKVALLSQWPKLNAKLCLFYM